MENEKTIRYFSMFTGVGGFEVGLEATGCRNGKCNCEEEMSRNTSRNKSVFKGQEESNNSTDNREITDNENPDRALLQDRQEQGNTFSRDLEEIKGDIKSGQSIRQTSNGVLREGSGLRNDSEGLRLGEDKSHISTERANDISKTKRNESRGNKEDGSSIESELLASKQFTCIGMSEIDKYSNQVLKYKFPTIKNWGDCTKINPNELPDFDMLCGGFPCQSFSIAGKRRGFQDTRGTMFFEIARILKIKRPKIIFLENVKGLLNHKKGETFSVILEALDELGYDVQWMVLNSKFFGVPQNRERVFIIGSSRGTSISEILPFGFNCEKTNRIYGESEKVANTINTSIGRNQSDGQYITHPTITETIRRQGSSSEYINSIKYIQQARSQHSRIYDTEGISPTLAGASKLSGDCTPKIRAVLTPDRPEKRQQGRRFKEGEPSFTLTGQDIHGVMEVANCVTPDAYLQSGKRKRVDGKAVLTSAHERRIRRLTPTECCRLQGFLDDWNEWGIDEKENKVKMSDTQRYKQMGNAVTVNVIRAIAEKLLKNGI